MPRTTLRQSRDVFAPDNSMTHPPASLTIDADSLIARGVAVSQAPADIVDQSPPSVLLARPGYAGTIAAIRDLARDQISVSVLSENLLQGGRWSKYVHAHYRTGPQANPEALLSALETLKAENALVGPSVLLPTCDNSAWTYAAYEDTLAPYFRLYAPSLRTMERILDKRLFESACAEAGVPVLKSWTVRNVGEVEKIADSLEFPLILKPRTHVRRRRNDKGEVVANLDQLTSALKRVEHSESFYGLSGDAESDFFMQRFVEVFPKGVLSVTGFIDRSGSRFVARAARKILLRSEPAGVGVCFESTPLDPALADQTARLCRTLGYFGVFEVEFVWDGAGWAAIDFNPRFYNQMALDIARGLPLARLCYYDAIGHTHRLAQLFEHANAASAESKLCVRDGFTMSLIVAFRSLTGRMLRDERRGWSAWSKRNRMGMLDLIHSHDDPWVWPVHMISEVRLGMRKLFSVAKNRIGRAGKSHA